MLELDRIDRDEIARLIQEGNTSGILNNGEGKNISWKLDTEIWSDDDE